MSDKYNTWKERAEKHDLNHNTTIRNKVKIDFSCNKCYPSNLIGKNFKRFWKWYKNEVPEVESYSAKTEDIFIEFLNEGNDFDTGKWNNVTKNRIKGKIGKLLGSMRYNESPKQVEKDIGEKLIIMTIASDKFEKSV